MGVLLFNPRIPVQPAQNLLMPHQAILLGCDPMILIGEIQQTTRHSPFLQDIKETETLGNGQPEVVVAVNNQLRRVELQNVLGG